MTEQTDEITPTDEVNDTPNESDTPADEQEQTEGKKTLRQRAQSAETERDELAGRLEAMQRAEVERVASETVSSPATLWSVGLELSDVLHDDGTVNASVVKQAAEDAVQAHGLSRPMHGAIVPGAGRMPKQRSGATWEDALK